MNRVYKWILGAGGAVIIVLFLVFMWISSALKNHLEDAINTHLSTLQEWIPTLSYEPFACGGFGRIVCKSSRLALEGAIFEHVRIETKGLANERGHIAIMSDSVFLPGREFLPLLFGMVDPDTDFSPIMVPSSMRCDIEGRKASSIIKPPLEQSTPQASSSVREGGLDWQIQCHAKATNLTYALNLDMFLPIYGMAFNSDAPISAQEHILGSTITDDTWASMNFSAALRAIMQVYHNDAQRFVSHMPLFLRNASLSLSAHRLPQAIIAKITDDVELKDPVYNEYYADLVDGIDSAKTFALYVATLGRKSIPKEFETTASTLSRMMLGQNAGVVFTLTPNIPMMIKDKEHFILLHWLQEPLATLRKGEILWRIEEIISTESPFREGTQAYLEQRKQQRPQGNIDKQFDILEYDNSLESSHSPESSHSLESPHSQESSHSKESSHNDASSTQEHI